VAATDRYSPDSQRLERGLDRAQELFEGGAVLRAASLLYRTREQAQTTGDQECLAEIEGMAVQMRSYLEGEELSEFDRVVANGGEGIGLLEAVRMRLPASRLWRWLAATLLVFALLTVLNGPSIGALTALIVFGVPLVGVLAVVAAASRPMDRAARPWPRSSGVLIAAAVLLFVLSCVLVASSSTTRALVVSIVLFSVSTVLAASAGAFLGATRGWIVALLGFLSVGGSWLLTGGFVWAMVLVGSPS
jgi:hypothetical protein